MRVPTAPGVGLGQSVGRSPDPVFQQAQTDADMFGAAQGRDLTQTGEALQAAGQRVQQAFERVQNRADLVSRARELNDLQSSLSTEFMKMRDEKDLTKAETHDDFSKFITQRANEVLSRHQGSADSQALLAAEVQNMTQQYRADATALFRSEDIKQVKQRFGGEINTVMADITSGALTLDQGLLKIAKLGDGYASTFTDSETFEMIEAAQSLAVEHTVQRFIDMGAYEEAEALINDHPEVIQTLLPDRRAGFVRQIETQKNAFARRLAELTAEQHVIAQSWGYESVQAMPPALRAQVLYSAASVEPPEPLTAEGRQAWDRDLLVRQFGPDSPQVKGFDQSIDIAQAANDPEILKLMDRREELIADGVPEDDRRIRVIDAQIDSMDPAFKRRQEQLSKLPAARHALDSLRHRTEEVMANVQRAAELLTGEQGSAAFDALRMGEFEFGRTGTWGRLLTNIPGADARELKQVLETLRANEDFGSLSALRTAFPTGSEVGSLTEEELGFAQIADGSFDMAAPEELALSLLRLHESAPRALQRLESHFRTDFADVLPNESSSQEIGAGQSAPEGDIEDIPLDGFKVEAPAASPEAAPAAAPEPVAPASTTQSEAAPTEDDESSDNPVNRRRRRRGRSKKQQSDQPTP